MVNSLRKIKEVLYMPTTLKERDPQEFAGLMGLYDIAIERVNDPEFERVAPPPRRIKRRAHL